jgi:SAM-dependent methyltransferase
MIDVGCGDARVTAELARRWRLPPDRALAVDVFDRVADRSAITYIPLTDGRIACAAGVADRALLLMVLHHEADPDRLLAEVRRALTPGGRLFVRESDVDTPELKLFNAVMEDFYYQVFRKLPGVPNPARHDAVVRWQARIEWAGFRVDRVDRPEPGNPFTPVHIHAAAV